MPEPFKPEWTCERPYAIHANVWEQADCCDGCERHAAEDPAGFREAHGG